MQDPHERHDIISQQVGRQNKVLGFALKVAVLAGLAFTAIQSVIVPRGLYADGAYDLWLVLNTKTFQVIGSARTFAILLNQLPVVTAMKLGVRDLDVLIGFYTFGVAAVPVLIWILALVIQFHERFFWPLVVIYAATFLNSGFIAIGEYTYAFALVALSVSILLVRGPIRARLAIPLVISATALILCYEGMVVLGLPLMALTLIRLKRRQWVAHENRERSEQIVLWYVLICFGLSAAVAGLSIGMRTLNSADTNLAGALNVQFALQTNRQWQLSAVVAVLLILSLAIRERITAAILRLLLAVLAGRLFFSSIWSPAWLHYNTRSLAMYTYSVLLVIALLALILSNRKRLKNAKTRGSGRAGLQTLSFSLTASMLFFSLSIAFWSMNQGYGAWIRDFRSVVISREGPIDIATTDLYSSTASQFSWGWTNPYLSALMATKYGQGSVLSHVDKLDHFAPISPPSTPQFFEYYHHRPVQ